MDLIFFTLVESLEVIFSQYKETCEVLLDYPKIGGEDIKDFAQTSIMNLLYSNINVHSRSLIYEFLGNAVKYISKLQSHCANMTFSDRIRYAIIFQQVTHKVG